MSIEVPGQIGLAEPLIAAIDNGATNTRVSLRQGDEESECMKYETPHSYEDAIVRVHSIARLLANGRKIDAVGFAVAGKIIDGRIVQAGELQDRGWVGLPFQKNVAGQFGLETDRVILHNDCMAAAIAQRVANQKVGGPEAGYVETISTGNGGAGFDEFGEIEDEPGHEILRPGAICGCGKDGCIEAYISGSGIERNRYERAEKLSLALWKQVIADAVEAHVMLINRFEAMGSREQGFRPAAIHFFGSVALKQPHLLLPGLEQGLKENRDRLPYMPIISTATYGDDSGLVGAGEAALALLR